MYLSAKYTIIKAATDAIKVSQNNRPAVDCGKPICVAIQKQPQVIKVFILNRMELSLSYSINTAGIITIAHIVIHTMPNLLINGKYSLSIIVGNSSIAVLNSKVIVIIHTQMIPNTGI